MRYLEISGNRIEDFSYKIKRNLNGSIIVRLTIEGNEYIIDSLFGVLIDSTSLYFNTSKTIPISIYEDESKCFVGEFKLNSVIKKSKNSPITYELCCITHLQQERNKKLEQIICGQQQN